jgi:hypothetical protein
MRRISLPAKTRLHIRSKLNVILKSARTFVIYRYIDGHGLLLLRSRKTDRYPTRFEILFKDVRAMEVRCWFDGISIEEVDPDYLAPFKSNPIELLEPGNRVYSLRGSNWQGFVLGGSVFTNEDDREFRAPSDLWSMANPLDAQL